MSSWDDGDALSGTDSINDSVANDDDNDNEDDDDEAMIVDVSTRTVSRPFTVHVGRAPS